MINCRIAAVSAITAAGNDLVAIHKATCGNRSSLKQQEYAGISSSFGRVNVDSLPEDWPQRHRSRNNALLWMLMKQIQARYNLLSESIPANRIGVVIGTSTSGISELEPFFKGDDGEYSLEQQEISSGATALAQYLGLSGPVLAVSTACSSGANALATARRWLASDVCDLVIAGGVDTLCAMTAQGFNALGAMSNEACLPFAKERQGMNLGEGGALFLLDSDHSGTQLLGVGVASDAHHFSAPHPEGEGAIAAMTKALNNASLEAKDIDYINLHGTATLQNDAMESLAVAKVFTAGVPCSSTKGHFGHTLGAAGAVEAALCVQTLVTGVLPRNISVNYDSDLAELNLVQTNSTKAPVSYCLSNSFAFGGSNVSLILGIGDE